jgi:hypothetical protein
MIGRRNLLRMIGLAPVAGVAGADKLVGLGGGAASIFGGGITSAVVDGPPHSIGDGTILLRATKAWNYIRGNNLPEHVLARIRRNADDIYRLDPDLAVNRSFSLATKMRVQKEREIERAIKKSVEDCERGVLSAKFQEATGLDLW